MKDKRKKSFEGYMDINELDKLKWYGGVLQFPHLCRSMPYEYEKKVKVTIEEL
jgi:hypothetical protein